MAIFAPAESLPSPATLPRGKRSFENYVCFPLSQIIQNQYFVRLELEFGGLMGLMGFVGLVGLVGLMSLVSTISQVGLW